MYVNTCKTCGRKFSQRHNPNQAYCSKSCAKRFKYKDTLGNPEWLMKQRGLGLSTYKIAALIGASNNSVSKALRALRT